MYVILVRTAILINSIALNPLVNTFCHEEEKTSWTSLAISG